MDKREPKYNFGLLETPHASESSFTSPHSFSSSENPQQKPSNSCSSYFHSKTGTSSSSSFNNNDKVKNRTPRSTLTSESSRFTPGARPTPRIAPGSRITPGLTPGLTPGSRITPGYRTTSGLTSGSRITPGYRTAPGLTSGSRITPGLTPGSRATPGYRTTPGLTSGSRITPGSRIAPGLTPGSRATPRITPGSRVTPWISSATSTTTPQALNSTVIVAIVEGRGIARGEIGMTSLDLKSPTLVLSQFSDSQTYVKTLTKLQTLAPLEIIVPNTSFENGKKTTLLKLISDQYSTTCISAVQRKYFNETKGLQMLKHLCKEFHTMEMVLSSKYYCLATTAAILKYIEFIQNIEYAPSSLQLVFKGSENSTMIDMATSRNLELLQNLRDPKSHHTLFGTLNFTKTPGGTRLLRSNILQPPSDVETIKLRQDVISELVEKEEIFYNIQTTLSKFLDIEHLISACVMIPKQDSLKVAESKITTVILLKHTLDLVPAFVEFLKDCENDLIKAYCQTLQDSRYEEMREKISIVIHDDTKYQKGALNMRTQKCFAVKPHINGLLDVARRTYSEIINDISEMINQLGEDCNLPLKLAYSTTRGFYIQLFCGQKDNRSADSLPGNFIKVSKFKNTLSFTTTDLIKLNDRVKESLQEIYLMTNVVVTELMNEIRQHIGCLYKLSEAVSMIDMLVSFTHACTLSSYVRPVFTDTLAIKQGRHPILEKIGVNAPVPNNTYAAEDNNFIIITGPNMSGKSTYLRQVVLLQIMAQMGSFVPAQYASFRVSDQIFSRIGSDDDIETNSSTFMVEMKEINYIIQNATDKSLIIIDELGRGTSADEGVGLCHAISEHLLSFKAFTLFVTHFMDLTHLASLYPNVENYFFEVQRTFSVEGNCEKMAFTHNLSRGQTKEKHYGLKLAELSTMPSRVIEEANQLSKILEKKDQKTVENKEAIYEKAVFKLGMRLVQTANNSSLDPQSLRGFLKMLKVNFEKEVGTDTTSTTEE